MPHGPLWCQVAAVRLVDLGLQDGTGDWDLDSEGDTCLVLAKLHVQRSLQSHCPCLKASPEQLTVSTKKAPLGLPRFGEGKGLLAQV